MLKKIILNTFAALLIFVQVNAQNTWENYRSGVYPYLSRMAQKGLVDFADLIQPVSRDKIKQALTKLNSQYTLLSNIEKAELKFYLEEYPILTDSTNNTNIQLLKKDVYKRWRSINLNSNEFEFHADPIVSIESIGGTGKSIKQVSNGFDIWGSAGKNKKWAYQVYYRDYTETGTVDNNYKLTNPEKGIILVGDKSESKINYSEVRANLSYAWKNGSLSIGKDNITWGYGENSKIVLSDLAPSFPYIRFDYTPLKWMSFHYENAWLNSNIIDSTRTYPTFTNDVMGDIRYAYIPKFLALHSITIKPFKGLDISIGESIIYSDKLDIGFLMPINLFKIYDNNRSNYLINAGSNGQYFIQLNSRNQIKNSHLYASLFIDEIKVSAIFDKIKSRNQLGFTIGGSLTDAFIHYLTMGAEYSRVNPFVYSNLIPAQFYTQYDYNLGDWMGNNFDRASLFAKYSPLPKLRMYLKFEKIRKGGAGTIYQQYLVQPQQPFLFNYQYSRQQIFGQLIYEYIHNLYLNASMLIIQNKYNNGSTLKESTFKVGVSFGLN